MVGALSKALAVERNSGSGRDAVVPRHSQEIQGNPAYGLGS